MIQMDLLTFVSEVISSVVWPVAIIVLAWMLRPAFMRLPELIKTLRYKDWELTFGEGISQLREKLPPHFSQVDAKEARISELVISDQFKKDVKTSPTYAILNYWSKAEGEIRKLARDKEIDTEGKSLREIFQDLVSGGTLADPDYRSFAALQNLRNLAAHDHRHSVTEGEAYDFALYGQIFLDILAQKRASGARS